jgi:23S rRNA pseudouridine1911/1915/1917 synthase
LQKNFLHDFLNGDDTQVKIEMVMFMSFKQKNHGKWIAYRVTPEWEGHTVREVLQGPLLLSNRMINRLTRSRGIQLNGKMPWLDRRVKAGDRLRVAVRPFERADLPPEPVPFSVVYEDADLMVVDKPAGINVHPVRPGEGGTLAHGIIHYWLSQGREGRVRPVHRLDRDTSGLILIAKHAYAHQLLDRDLRQHDIRREYLACVAGRVENPEGTIREPIARDPNHPLRRCVSPEGDPAVTHYRVLAQNDRASIVWIQLETGRTHQIRVHFSWLGHPLYGDKLYGGPMEGIGRQALHAWLLSFRHPLTGKNLTLKTMPPEDWLKLTESLHFVREEWTDGLALSGD